MSRRILLLRFACQSVTRPVDARLSQRYDGGHGAAGSAAGDCVHVVAAVNSAGWQPAQCVTDRRQCTGLAGASTHSAQRSAEYSLSTRTYDGSLTTTTTTTTTTTEPPDNNNNNNLICIAPECQKTSEALEDRER